MDGGTGGGSGVGGGRGISRDTLLLTDSSFFVFIEYEDGPMDGQTDLWTDCLIALRGRI